MSDVPPGTKGTTKRIGLAGQADWAKLAQGIAMAVDASAVCCSKWRRVKERVGGRVAKVSMVMSALLACIGNQVKHGADSVGKTGPHAAAPFGFTHSQPGR